MMPAVIRDITDTSSELAFATIFIPLIASNHLLVNHSLDDHEARVALDDSFHGGYIYKEWDLRDIELATRQQDIC